VLSTSRRAETAASPLAAPQFSRSKYGWRATTIYMKTILTIALLVAAAGGCKNRGGKPAQLVAVHNLLAIRTAAREAYLKNGTFPVGEVGLTPAARCCEKPGGQCAVDTTIWQHPVWSAIGFSVTAPQPFQYSYKSDGKTFSATAVGDDGCDGTTISYEYRGESNGGTPSGTMIIPPREQ
jgi:hypothetical protein